MRGQWSIGIATTPRDLEYSYRRRGVRIPTCPTKRGKVMTVPRKYIRQGKPTEDCSYEWHAETKYLVISKKSQAIGRADQFGDGISVESSSFKLYGTVEEALDNYCNNIIEVTVWVREEKPRLLTHIPNQDVGAISNRVGI